MAIIVAVAVSAGAPAETGALWLRNVYEREIDRRLELPPDAQEQYAQMLAESLAAAGLADLPSQLFVLVDRDESTQAVMVWWKSGDDRYELIGASPASTGKPGKYEHFWTPLGVFEHSLANPDFRAEGTLNENGILGYGRKGMRVYDFGWQPGARGWGAGGESLMRLQMHSTDPDLLEPRIGTPQSKGCIRVPAALNQFIDRYAILDAAYEEAARAGAQMWMLRADRQPTPWSGRYLVIVDSQRAARPVWSRQLKR